jgi:hypothetical protein
MIYHDGALFHYQTEYIRSGKCHRCSGTGQVCVNRETYEKGPCLRCGGTGEATKKDRERLALHDKGTCLICKLPLVEGQENNPASKYDNSGINDCLDHLRQYVLALEKSIVELMEERFNG